MRLPIVEYADSADNMPLDEANIAVGTGLISFDGNGNFISATNSTVAIDRRILAFHLCTRVQFRLFRACPAWQRKNASIAASRQDSSPPAS
ncbi:MAG: hypothetical protein U0930_11070 [Pirellulales bacterium]